MDATKLEEYVRYRHDAKGDIGRIERQQWFMRQVKKKLEEPQTLLKLPDFFKLANDYVRTDLSVEEMAKLAGFCRDIKPGQIQTAMLPAPVPHWWWQLLLPDPESAAIVLRPPDWLTDGNGDHRQQYRLNYKKRSKSRQMVELISATPPITNDNVNEVLAASYNDRPTSVIVRYPKNGEHLAKVLQERLEAKGFTVKFRQRGESSDCAHEQIVETSYRADDEMMTKLKSAIAELEPFAVSVNLDAHASSDLIIVLSPTTAVAAP